MVSLRFLINETQYFWHVDYYDIRNLASKFFWGYNGTKIHQILKNTPKKYHLSCFSEFLGHFNAEKYALKLKK